MGMSAGDRLAGMLAQGLGGGGPAEGYTALYSYSDASAVIWECPRSGIYEFAVWSAGHTINGGNGATGGLGIIRRNLGKGQSVSLVVGRQNGIPSGGGGGSGGVNTPSSVTFPGEAAKTVTNANSVGTAVAGVATGFDVNINGTVVTTATPGPSYGAYKGGTQCPGGALAEGTDNYKNKADGLIVITRVL